MKKIRLGPNPYIYPMPTVIVGTHVNGTPNFITVAYCGIVQHQPPMVAVTLINSHYTNEGIRENKCFSVNIPNTRMLNVTDFLGMNSGENVDKSDLFKIFYGTLPAAPLIEETPLNLECKLVQTIDLYNNSEIFIGEIIETYSAKKYLKKGKPYIKKLDPILFSINTNNYFKVGRRIGSAWRKGLDYRKKS